MKRPKIWKIIFIKRIVARDLIISCGVRSLHEKNLTDSDTQTKQKSTSYYETMPYLFESILMTSLRFQTDKFVLPAALSLSLYKRTLRKHKMHCDSLFSSLKQSWRNNEDKVKHLESFYIDMYKLWVCCVFAWHWM